MARGVARSTRGGEGRRTINARTGNDANRIARKRSKERGSQRQAERNYRQDRADQRYNRLQEKGVDIRTGRTFNPPAGGNLNAATGSPARQTDRVLITPAPGDRRRGGGLNAIRNARNVRPGGGDRRLRRASTPTPATGNAGGGSGNSDPNKNRGSRRAASATGPAPVVRPRPSEARAARGRLIRQIANRRQNARRSQRTT